MALWLMPMLQTAFLGAFTTIAAFEVWRSYWLLLAAFGVGATMCGSEDNED